LDELTDFEKLVQGISQFAALVRAYYEALKESGFTHKDAMVLTAQYQKDVLNMAKPNNNAG
jgi:hypothetical protein